MFRTTQTKSRTRRRTFPIPLRPGSARRRGTFLILVVAILAFLALLTIAYVTLGRADERASSTLRQSDRVQSVERSVAEYIAQIIADDAVSVADMGFGFEIQDRRLVPRIPHLAAWDYPSIDGRYRSNITEPTLPANPANARAPFNPVGTFGDDPFLASSEPTFIWLPNNSVRFQPNSGTQTPTGVNRPAWPVAAALGAGLEPSNFGNPPGLAQLRVDWLKITNVAPNGRYVNLGNLRGNFDAEPGIASGQMSHSLTHPGQPNTLITAAADLNNPAIFTENQFNAYRPLDLADNIAPNDLRYFPYQWADADGDGFADSRWFELIDNSGGVVPSATRYRWFAAVRIVDLSAMVNVNTATSLRGNPEGQPVDLAPTRQHPVGASLADVDLRRIISMADLIDQGGSATPFGRRMLYQNYAQPNSQGSVSAMNSLTSDYLFELGDRAYESLRLSLLTPNTLDLGPGFEALDFRPPSTPASVYDYTAAERALSFELAPSRSRFDRSSERALSGDAFGIESLAELLTFRTANDPNTFSALESALSVDRARNNQPFVARGGMTGSGGRPNFAYYHILRAQRPASLEHLVSKVSLENPSQIRPEALAQSFGDPRQRLTTLSGHRPFITRPNFSGSITDDDLAISAPAIARNMESTNASSREAGLQALFTLYADALLPYSDRTLGQVTFSNGGTADFRQVWNWNNGNNVQFNRLRTLFYGHRGPEFALLTAAHAAVNMADLLDSNTPGSATDPITSRTVLMDGAISTNNTLKSQLLEDAQNTDVNSRRQPWAYARGEGALGAYAVLDLDGPEATQVQRLADTTDGDTLQGSPAYNVFGIEPTPVITEVASFHIYTDAHASAGGDGENEEWEDITPPPPPFLPPIYQWLEGGPTIDGRVTDGNSDFIAQVVVVQLHNPFSTPVSLSTTTSDGEIVPRFYIQFGERPPAALGGGGGGSPRFFPVASLSDDDWGNNFTSTGWSSIPSPLAPGETRNVVLTTQSLTTINSKIRNAAVADGLAVPPDADLFGRWLSAQLMITQTVEGAQIERQPIVVAEFNPEQPSQTDLSAIRSPANIDMLAATDDPARVGQVLLWRAVYTPGETGTQALTANDQLVDRLRDPSLRYGQPFEATLDGRLPSNFVVNSPNSQAGPDPSESGGPVGDNTGFSVTMWASIRRPSTNTTPAEAQAFPSWMFEFKRTGANVDNSANATRRLTPAEVNSNENFTVEAFRAEGAHPSFSDLLRRQGAVQTSPGVDDASQPGGGGGGATPTQVRLLPTLRQSPNIKTGNDIGINPNNSLAFERLQIEMLSTERSESSRRLFSTEYGSGAQARTISTIRAADFLRPLAIGPRFNPARIDPNLTPNNQEAFRIANISLEDLEEAWLTLPEALALATGYYDSPSNRTPNNTPGDGSLDVSFAVGGLDQGRGSLTQDTLPLLDRGHLRIDAFAPFVNFNQPQVAAFSLPNNNPPGPGDDYIVGLGIPLAANIPSRLRTPARDQGNTPVALGSTTEAIPGTINVNTAAVDVLRTIPLFSPLPSTLDPGNIAGSNSASNVPAYPIPSYFWDEDGANAVHDVRSDIAATLLGYRDLIGVTTRRAGDLSEVQVDPDFLNFSLDPTDPRTGRRNRPGGDPNALPIAGADAIRNAPGLLSTGEILNLRATTIDQSVIGSNYIEPHSIDRLGLHPFIDGPAIQPVGDINLPGVDNLRYGDLSGPNSQGNSDRIDGEYDQRLAIANAALAATSVRSDYYAVWFVLHGYQRADVEGLAPNQPMVPSVRRRYLMIIDRSNITSEGQLPRILDFRRVPD